MKPAEIFVVLFAAITLMASAFAKAAINDLPVPVYTCEEVINGAVVRDGAKTVVVERGQFGQHTLTLTQRDQISGDSVLVKGLPLVKKECRGYSPCDLFVGSDAKGNQAQFFVNFHRGMKFQPGQLELKVNRAVASLSLLCRN